LTILYRIVLGSRSRFGAIEGVITEVVF
jgi:hypothetical protein